jgi:hypothetical protein
MHENGNRLLLSSFWIHNLCRGIISYEHLKTQLPIKLAFTLVETGMISSLNLLDADAAAAHL